MTLDDTTINTASFWQESTEERYEDALNALPPIDWNCLSFLLGEPFDHDDEGRPRYDAHRKVGGRYEVGAFPVNVRDFRKLRGVRSCA